MGEDEKRSRAASSVGEDEKRSRAMMRAVGVTTSQLVLIVLARLLLQFDYKAMNK